MSHPEWREPFLAGHCPLCGRSPKDLWAHLKGVHGLRGDDFRAEAGLPSLSEQKSLHAKRNWARLSDYERRHKARGLLAVSPKAKSEWMKRAAANRTPEQIAAYAERLNRTSSYRVRKHWESLTPEERSARTAPARTASPMGKTMTPSDFITPARRAEIARIGQQAQAAKRRAAAEHRRAMERAYRIEERAYRQGRDLSADEKAERRHHLRIAESIQL